MSAKIFFLNHRAILEISGADRVSFLQGLVTNDVSKVGNGALIYTAMLNAQGRFLYDFFIFQHKEKLFLDCDAVRRDEILKKLNFYKLRAKVEIKKNDEMAVMQIFSATQPQNFSEIFPDPRTTELGFRTYDSKEKFSNFSPINEYHFARISKKIPEGELDLTYEKSFILEFDFDNLNAIDYQKGCYVGQELTARTHYRGEIRKKLEHLEFPADTKLRKGDEIPSDKKMFGEVLSSASFGDKLHALAIIKIV